MRTRITPNTDTFRAVIFCKIRWMSWKGKGGFLNSDDVGQRGKEGSENPCFFQMPFVDGSLQRLNLC